MRRPPTPRRRRPPRRRTKTTVQHPESLGFELLLMEDVHGASSRRQCRCRFRARVRRKQRRRRRRCRSSGGMYDVASSGRCAAAASDCVLGSNQMGGQPNALYMEPTLVGTHAYESLLFSPPSCTLQHLVMCGARGMLSECEEREMYLIRQVRDSLSSPPFLYIYNVFSPKKPRTAMDSNSDIRCGLNCWRSLPISCSRDACDRTLKSSTRRCRARSPPK